MASVAVPVLAVAVAVAVPVAVAVAVAVPVPVAVAVACGRRHCRPRCRRVLSWPLTESVMVRWLLTTSGTVPGSPGLVPGRALRLALPEDGWRAGGPVPVPLAGCPGRADGGAQARCWTDAGPAVTASTMPMSPAIATEARIRTGLRRSRRASVRARDAGRGAAGTCDRASSARSRPASSPVLAAELLPQRPGIERLGGPTGAEIVPQIVPQPACLLRDLGGAARPASRIFGDELHR